MAGLRVANLGGINLYTNPLLKKDGDAIRAVNVTSEPYGAKSKRSGYITFLGTADGQQVNSLFSWTKNDGTSLFLYRASGTLLQYSLQGTGAWTTAVNGTISNGGHVGYAVLDNTLIIGDGVGSTRHTTNGTSFTDTVLAPVGEHFAQYQNRIYLGGTSSTLFYSTTNDATNWSTGGTADSSSLQIPGAGKIHKIFKCADRLVSSKSSGEMYRWDGYSLVDMATKQGPTSPYAVDQKEGYYFWPNRDGIQGYDGSRPRLLSNAIQPMIYNNTGSAIAGTVFDNSPAVTHRYDYLWSCGTVTDGFTLETTTNTVIKYDMRTNEFLTWDLAHRPTAWHSYKDVNGVQQLIFGDSSGQCYQFSGTATTDAGTAISTYLEYVIDLSQPENDKLWRWFWGFFNPGCQAKIQIVIGDTYRRDSKLLQEIRDTTSGVVEVRLPTDNARGKLLFIRVYESSKEAPFTFYGFMLDADIETRK